jgi:hypothetical protein
MREVKFMKCNHSANAITKKDGEWIDICTFCHAINPDSEIEADPPDLTGRKARCGYCGETVDSNLGLAFFGYQPDKETDSYYCGCFGWD